MEGMNCTDSQDVVEELDKGPNDNLNKKAPFSLSLEEIDLALEHMDGCADCKTWFSENRCPKMVDVTVTDAFTFITLKQHQDFHKDFEIPDCKTLS